MSNRIVIRDGVICAYPKMEVGAGEHVYKAGKNYGLVIRERSDSGHGWTFRVTGPNGDPDLRGFWSFTDAVLVLVDLQDL